MKFDFIAKHWGDLAGVMAARSAGCVSLRPPCLARATGERARRVRRDVLAERISSGLHRIELLMCAQPLRLARDGTRRPPYLGERLDAAVDANVLNRALAV